ncbi:TQO small subunit DoxD [Rubripirellula obstinata]|nr:TQO small subunit DoxD [Rubripirellula obstinata]
MLVLLRLSIGWHFYTEGLTKHNQGNWTAAPFFANARGPLAEQYRQMVWDYDGRYRLNKSATMQVLAVYREQVATHFDFDKDQKRQAQANYAKAIDQFDWVMDENAADIEEFKLGIDRVKKFDTDAKERSLREGVDSLGGQRDTIRREWTGKARPALDQIDKIWDNYAVAQNAIASERQLAAKGKFPLRKPRTNRIDTSIVDGLLPYFDIAVGLCLLLGLFTPVAALAAGVFLFSVFLSQYPPETGTTSSNYQLIESMACFVLASTGAGRFAGLDYFLHLFVRKSEADEFDEDDDA